ncbi:MAG: SCP2 sterol-binding domain-containing protein [Pseudomonadota bacterium]
MLNLALDFFALLVNQYIKLDYESHTKLKALTEHNIAIEISDLNLSFFILLAEDKLFLTTNQPDMISVRFKATSKTYFEYLISEIKGDQSFPKAMEITGDIEFAQAFQRFFKSIEIDWEEQLAKLTGDTIASQIGKVVKKTTSYFSTTTQTVKQNIQEYFQEELAIFPNRLALEDLYQQIDDLNLAFERLDARWQRLHKERNPA